MLGTMRLADWQEGPPGSGQGGYSAYRFCEIAGHDLSVRLHAPVPLETDLSVGQDDDGRFTLTDPTGTLIMSGRQAEFDCPTTTPVTIDDARGARERTAVHVGVHGAPNCFSCGIKRESMGVHPGPLDDGRYACELTPPEWTLTPNRLVDPYVFWAALDCTAGIFVASWPDERIVVTANYQVRMPRHQINPGSFAIVAFPIDGAWDGRKRWAASAAFDADGHLIAEARSLWVSLDGR